MSAAPLSIGPGAQLFGARSRQGFVLGPKIARGGEGTVFALQGQPGFLAKIYHKGLDHAKIHKLKALVEAANPNLTAVSAWPQDILVIGKSKAAGFVMPEIQGAEPLHKLYSPKSRLQHFPNLRYAQLVQIAANAAHAVDTFHEASFILGDINGSNLLVLPDGTVRIIDCDSVQIGKGRHHRCPVGTEEFLAPDLQGVALGRIKRSLDHDNFALAVLIFLLLGMGRHPFSGAGLDATIGKAIAQNLHPFGKMSKSQPLQALGLSQDQLFTPALQAHFKLAFEKKRMFSAHRPTARQWITALQAYMSELQVCPANDLHSHPKSVRQCPWCAMEKTGKPAMFKSTQQVAVAPALPVDAATIWSWIGVAAVLFLLWLMN